MKNKYIYGLLPFLSGGIAGLTAMLAFLHLGDKDITTVHINPILTIFVFIICAFVFIFIWYGFSKYMNETFKENIENELKTNSYLLSAGIPAILALLMILKFYLKLAAIDLKVVGAIYLPFKHYMHVNFAGYSFFMLFGGIIVFSSFALIIRFLYKIYSLNNVNLKINITKSIFTAFLIFYGVTTTYITMIYPPTGDEPHYILIAKSLGDDLDVNLENNYSDFAGVATFYPTALEWKSIHNTSDKNNQGIYSLHSPGLPALMVLVYKVSGRYGMQLIMNLICASLIGALYLLLISNGFSEKISILCATIIGLTIPLAASASLILTEIPSAFLITIAFLKISRMKSEKNMLIYFVIIGMLPFFHTKLMIISAALYIYYYFIVFKNKEFSIKREIYNNIAVLIFAILLLLFYQLIYGKFAGSALTSIYVSKSFYFIFSLLHSVKAFFGIMMDRDFGIIAYNWFLLTSLFGVMLCVLNKELKRLILLFILLPYAALYLFWSDWGGSMVPGRQLIPIIPGIALATAYFIKKTSFVKSTIFKVMTVQAIIVSFILTVIPAFRYTSGKDKIYKVIMDHFPALLWIFPSFNDIITPVYFATTIYGSIIVFIFFRATKRG